VLDKQTEVGIR